MERSLRLTGDGTHTLYVKEMDESYHSLHGALQESKHVFIEAGFERIRKSSINILEIGLGTGLNLLLTLMASLASNVKISYHAVEKYPLNSDEYEKLNFELLIPGMPEGCVLELHKSAWEITFNLAKDFSVFKEKSDFRIMNPPGNYDLVYFDAFSPEKQPHLWTSEIFHKLYHLMNPGALLLSYSAKGIVRRALTASGFNVDKIPGPPGKWEMIRATRT